mmetsp:Transcript_11189/g.69061  ORF Transcript_11189/g.69061 Transcript_11189/m.69061 type:complete len:109 (+) Transcript_11189:287-613(+)
MCDSSRSSRTDLESEPSSEEGPQHVDAQGKVCRADPNGGTAEPEHFVGANEDDSGIVEWDPRNRYCRVRARNEPRKEERRRGEPNPIVECKKQEGKVGTRPNNPSCRT